jgi:hypothetical protein
MGSPQMIDGRFRFWNDRWRHGLLFHVPPAREFLVGVSRSDALAPLSAGLLVGVAVYTASAIPAYRAGRVDLLKSLRHEAP